MKYAHTSDERKQTIIEHLHGVADIAKGYSVELTKEYAYAIGLAHDIGKYADVFQERLKGSRTRYEHSVCGAIELEKLVNNDLEKEMTYMLQYCVAGHHTGLPDGGTKSDLADGDNTLHSKLKRRNDYTGEADYSSYSEEINLLLPDYSEVFNILSHLSKTELIEEYAFFTRYLFSCLTDADFIDTERFFIPDVNRELHADFDRAEQIIDQKISSFKCDTPLQKARKSLQTQAISNSTGILTGILDMPTGSGKTLCSMKLALKLLREQKKKRIIYVIPYTSIIEQTAEIFEKLFVDCADIVQHHSNYCYDIDGDSTSEKLKRSTENWDAPIIITTSVQFFQSMYHYKGSALRKLHNIADSVIVLDEAHMLPTECLQPCLRAIGYIEKYLNSTVLFLSATMPDYSEMFRRFASVDNCTELIRDKSDFIYFKKCRYSYIGKTDIESITEKSGEYNSVLIIVNGRKTAREVYRLLTGRKYHLSTYMTPYDRSAVIEKIRSDLSCGEKITVVSTSLVEAGVDLDFQAVFRELAGLDSILQSGGRCNREGRREYGDVFIFETDNILRGDMKVRAGIVKDMLERSCDITSEECIKEYYKRLFDYSDELIERNTIAHNLDKLDSIPFRTYAEGFQFIREETISVVIDNCKETSELLSQLEYGGKNIRRRLQKYSVSLKIKGEFDKALSLGLLSDTGKGLYVLVDNSYYDKETGIDINKSSDYIFG